MTRNRRPLALVVGVFGVLLRASVSPPPCRPNRGTAET